MHFFTLKSYHKTLKVQWTKSTTYVLCALGCKFSEYTMIYSYFVVNLISYASCLTKKNFCFVYSFLRQYFLKFVTSGISL